MTEIEVLAAGSLRHVMRDLAPRFSRQAGVGVAVRHGPAGLLRAEIEEGAQADVFLSADLGHPKRLFERGLAGPVHPFATNRLVAVVRSKLVQSGQDLVDMLLDPAVAIGSSTPRKDPSGDYAWALFDKIDALRPGASVALKAKARQIVGGSRAIPMQDAGNPIVDAFRNGSIDIFLGYSTGTATLLSQLHDVEIVFPPSALSVVPVYGATVLLRARPRSEEFLSFLLSEPARRHLADFGFGSPETPDSLGQ